MTIGKTKNRLIASTSPYLLQHANNPVAWQPWDEKSLKQARKEDKPILISIGYSACHWCHVMEHQSFENEEIASIMNDHFVCIKIDREERPDLDQIYMDAIQNMGIHGGWPLNVFLTPDQRPFYGGTYFPPENWKELLEGVANAFKKNRKKLEESANGLTKELMTSEIVKYQIGQGEKLTIKPVMFIEMISLLEKKFDYVWGGIDKEPKFPMPSIWQFLLNFYQTQDYQKASEMAMTTLNKMAHGGIYDQIGGGFTRYSVDSYWHIPHFEKMLYDNGQLLSLYAKAYQIEPAEWILKTISKTVDWLKREMTSPEYGFYSALDADSEGEEGRYYCWSFDEFSKIAGAHDKILADYYDVKPNGNWVDGKNNYRLLFSLNQIAGKHKISINDLQKIIATFEENSLALREQRVKPGLDDKILTSWNGLMLKGLVDSYKSLGFPHLKDLAIKNGHFILNHLKNGNQLYRAFKNGNVSLNGYLEDYAWTIDAFFELYQITLDYQWLREARSLTDYAVSNFYDQKEKYFHFTDNNAPALIARKKKYSTMSSLLQMLAWHIIYLELGMFLILINTSK